MMKNKTANTLRKIFADKHNRELVVDSSIAFAIRGGAAAAAFIMNVIISRKLGAHEAGYFFLAFSVITILGTVVRMGGDYVVLRYVGIYGAEKKWVEVRGVIKNIITRVLLFSFLLTALTLIFTGFISESIFHKKDASGSFYWMFLAMPLLGIYTLYAFALQGLKKVLLSVAIQNLVVPILVILFVYIWHPKTSAELSKLYFFSSLITMGLTFYFWKRFVPAGKGEFDSSLLWKSCYALWTMAILQQAVQWGGADYNWNV